MRKLYPFILFFLLITFSSYSQSPVYKIAHSYFRTDPFQNEFSDFLNRLFGDPALSGKIIEKKTDTSLFYFGATYTNYNPFFFQPTKVGVILTETPVKIDSIRTDTIYSYQLLAYDNDSKEGMAELKKEFEKIYRRYKSGFVKTTHSVSEPEDKLAWETYNFFDDFHKLAPISLTWLGPDPNKEMCLVLTLRLTTLLNKAVLPVPLYAP